MTRFRLKLHSKVVCQSGVSYKSASFPIQVSQPGEHHYAWANEGIRGVINNWNIYTKIKQRQSVTVRRFMSEFIRKGGAKIEKKQTT